MSSNDLTKSKSLKSNDEDDDDSFNEQPSQIPYRRERTPSIVVQSLGLSFNKDSNITESIELAADDEEDQSQHSNSSEVTTDNAKSSSGTDEGQNLENSGSLSSLQGSSTGGACLSPVRGLPTSKLFNANKTSPNLINTNRRLSLNIGSTAPRRQSLTVDGLTASFNYPTGSATGSLRNKVALKPGHSLMGWIKLASTANNLSGTNGKIIEVTTEELAKHDQESDCWVALKGNVYNVTTYLQYHPGGVEELMRGAGKDATELFNEVHRWVNYESILAKCLVGPYKLESPLTNLSSRSEDSSSPKIATRAKDPTVAHKPPRRQSIALTVPSPNKYQSLLLGNNNINSNTHCNQIQQPPTYVIMQDKSCIRLKIQDLVTLPFIRSRHLICDLIELMEIHLSVIVSSNWLYRVHMKLDQSIEKSISAKLSDDDGTITVQFIKKEPLIWNKIGTSLDLNDSLCEMTLADKFFRPCQLIQKTKLTHDTYLFEFKFDNTLMYIPIGWHILIREYKSINDHQADENSNKSLLDEYRLHKNYTPVLTSLSDNDGLVDESGFMDRLSFIIKIYPSGMITSKLDQLNIGDKVEISDYQNVDFDVESHVMNPKHWVLFAAGTGVTPFCRIISHLLSQSEDNVKSVKLVFFNKTQDDIIWRDQFGKLEDKHSSRFQVTHVLSNEPLGSSWRGKRGKINKDLINEFVDSHSPDELQMLACGPLAFSQLTKSIVTELNLQERLYIFHG